jgi:hypothetical protein
MPTREIFRLGKDAAISKTTLRRAKDKLGTIQARRDGGLGTAGEWVWEFVRFMLPGELVGDDAQMDEDEAA